MHLRSHLRAMAAIPAAALFVAACGGGGGGNTATILTSYHPQAGVQGGQLVYSDWEPVQDLNVLSSTAATTQEVATGPIWASLWVFDPSNNAIPDLVTEVPSSSNGDVKQIDSNHMDVTIKLKSGLMWSDGKPLTTADLSKTITAICNADTGAASQTGYDHLASVTDTSSTVEVWHFGPDPTGKRCGGAMLPTDSGIYAPFISAMGFTPVPDHVLGSIAYKDWATSDYFTKKPTATSGPYMVQDFTPGPAAIVTMVPNPHYMDGRSSSDPFFGHKPYLDKLTYKIYGNKPAQIAGLQSGDSDLGLDLIAADLNSLKSITGYNTVNATGLLDEFLTFNLANNETGCDSQQFAASCGTPTVFANDKVLRQAADLAIDKDAIVANLVGGIGKTMNGPFVHALSPYFDTSIPTFQRDVAKANSMLDSDGWTKGADGKRSKNGKPLAWNISTTAGNQQRASEEQVLISNWAEIGATVTVKNWPAGQFFNDFKGGGILATGQYDMGMYANNWAPDPDSWCTIVESTQIPSSANAAGQNWSRANDPALDTACKTGYSTVDQNARIAAYKTVQSEWRDYLPTTQLYERPDVFTHSTKFGNFAPSVNTCLATCNAADWYNTAGKS